MAYPHMNCGSKNCLISFSNFSPILMQIMPGARESFVQAVETFLLWQKRARLHYSCSVSDIDNESLWINSNANPFPKNQECGRDLANFFVRPMRSPYALGSSGSGLDFSGVFHLPNFSPMPPLFWWWYKTSHYLLCYSCEHAFWIHVANGRQRKPNDFNVLENVSWVWSTEARAFRKKTESGAQLRLSDWIKGRKYLPLFHFGFCRNVASFSLVFFFSSRLGCEMLESKYLATVKNEFNKNANT